MEIELTRRYRFEAARRLPGLPAGHICQRVHGHSFRVSLRLRGPVDPHSGILIDYAEIDRHALPILQKLDHQYLNEVGDSLREPLLQNPSTEHLAVWLFRQLKPALPALVRVSVSETEDAEAAFEG